MATTQMETSHRPTAGPTAGNNSWTYNADEEEVTTNQLGAFSSPSDTYNNYVQTPWLEPDGPEHIGCRLVYQCCQW